MSKSSFLTIGLLSTALFLSGCGENNDVTYQASTLEFTQQPVTASHALLNSPTNPFELTLKDDSGNTINATAKVNLFLVTGSNAISLGQADMTNGVASGVTVNLSGTLEGNSTITAQVVNGSGGALSFATNSSSFFMVNEDKLSLAIKDQPTLNTSDPAKFSISAQFLATVNGTTSTTPVHGVQRNVHLNVASGSGTLIGTNPIPSTNGVATFTDYGCNATDSYTFNFTTDSSTLTSGNSNSINLQATL